jgi:predicted dienelactone hydrolase
MRLPALFLILSLSLGLIVGGDGRASELVQIDKASGPAVHASVFRPGQAACRGVAVLSHGAGGSELGYRYLGEALSSFGFLAVVPRHPESGREAVREAVRAKGLHAALSELIASPQAYVARFRDIDAVLAWAGAQCAQAAVRVLVGHSMGAATALLEAGARNRLGLEGQARFDGYIALSPQGAGSIFLPEAWSNIRRPVLTITGTQDTELGTGRWESRLEPYQSLPPGCAWLAVLEGATHLQFAGLGSAQEVEKNTVRIIEAFLGALSEPGCPMSLAIPGVDLRHK